jgi:hypothetical protein
MSKRAIKILLMVVDDFDADDTNSGVVVASRRGVVSSCAVSISGDGGAKEAGRLATKMAQEVLRSIDLD